MASVARDRFISKHIALTVVPEASKIFTGSVCHAVRVCAVSCHDCGSQEERDVQIQRGDADKPLLEKLSSVQREIDDVRLAASKQLLAARQAGLERALPLYQQVVFWCHKVLA